jgi:hypothetical protein
MKTLSSLGLGTSLIAATVTAAVVATAPAQAASLSGSVGLSGDLDIVNKTANGFTWKFSENVVNDQFGDFTGLSFPDSSLPQINDLAFTCYSGFCTTNSVSPFINFGQQTLTTKDGETTANLTFNLNAGQYLNFGVSGTTETTVSFPYLTGAFNFNGSTLAVGQLAGGYSGQSSTYQMTLKTVPEPLTIMGSGLALGFGGLFQRNASKRKNQKSA